MTKKKDRKPATPHPSGKGDKSRGRGVAREGGTSPREGGALSRGPGVDPSAYREQVSQALSAVEIQPSTIERGVGLYVRDRVRANKTYPWIFMVTGDRGRGHGRGQGGVALYRVDLSVPTCSCAYHSHTGRICKHIVAASCKFQERENA